MSLFILPLRQLKTSQWNDLPKSSRERGAVLTYHFVGPERVGKELFDVRVAGNLVYFRFAPKGPEHWANSGEFRAATGTEKDLKKLVRHQDKMFIQQLWGGGRTAAREGGLPKWCIS